MHTIRACAVIITAARRQLDVCQSKAVTLMSGFV